MLSNNKKESPHLHYKNMADDAVALQILDIVDKNARVSQHKIIKQTGLASGLVHLYMKKVINKGWVKAKRVSAKRWFYYLTPEGFLEKSRLTVKYLSITLQNYREANNRVGQSLQHCLENDWRRLVVAGVNDLAEISAVNIKASDDLQLIGVIAENADQTTLAGMDIAPYDAIADMEFDRIFICDVGFVNWLQERGIDDTVSSLLYI